MKSNIINLDIKECDNSDNIAFQPDVEISSPINTLKNDRFRILFTLPKCVSHLMDKDVDSDFITFTMTNLPVPKIHIPSLDIHYDGYHKQESSFKREKYEDLTINYHVDSYLKNYTILYYWINSISDEKQFRSKFETSSVKNYSTNVHIQLLDMFRNDYIISEWILKDAFITDLSGFELTFLNEGVQDVVGNFTLSYSNVEYKTYPEYIK